MVSMLEVSVVRHGQIQVYSWHLLFAETNFQIHEFQNSCTNLVEVVVEVQNSQVLLHFLILPCASAL